VCAVASQPRAQRREAEALHELEERIEAFSARLEYQDEKIMHLATADEELSRELLAAVPGLNSVPSTATPSDQALLGGGGNLGSDAPPGPTTSLASTAPSATTLNVLPPVGSLPEARLALKVLFGMVVDAKHAERTRQTAQDELRMRNEELQAALGAADDAVKALRLDHDRRLAETRREQATELDAVIRLAASTSGMQVPAAGSGSPSESALGGVATAGQLLRMLQSTRERFEDLNDTIAEQAGTIRELQSERERLRDEINRLSTMALRAQEELQRRLGAAAKRGPRDAPASVSTADATATATPLISDPPPPPRRPDVRMAVAGAAVTAQVSRLEPGDVSAGGSVPASQGSGTRSTARSTAVSPTTTLMPAPLAVPSGSSSGNDKRSGAGAAAELGSPFGLISPQPSGLLVQGQRIGAMWMTGDAGGGPSGVTASAPIAPIAPSGSGGAEGVAGRPSRTASVASRGGGDGDAGSDTGEVQAANISHLARAWWQERGGTRGGEASGKIARDPAGSGAGKRTASVSDASAPSESEGASGSGQLLVAAGRRVGGGAVVSPPQVPVPAQPGSGGKAVAGRPPGHMRTGSGASGAGGVATALGKGVSPYTLITDLTGGAAASTGASTNATSTVRAGGGPPPSAAGGGEAASPPAAVRVLAPPFANTVSIMRSTPPRGLAPSNPYGVRQPVVHRGGGGAAGRTDRERGGAGSGGGVMHVRTTMADIMSPTPTTAAATPAVTTATPTPLDGSSRGGSHGAGAMAASTAGDGAGGEAGSSPGAIDGVPSRPCERSAAAGESDADSDSDDITFVSGEERARLLQLAQALSGVGVAGGGSPPTDASTGITVPTRLSSAASSPALPVTSDGKVATRRGSGATSPAAAAQGNLVLGGRRRSLSDA